MLIDKLKKHLETTPIELLQKEWDDVVKSLKNDYNLIFLDIDGVMNSELFYRGRHRKRWFKPTTYYWLLRKTMRKVFGIKPKCMKDYKPPKNHDTFKYKYKRLVEKTDVLKWQWLVKLCENKVDRFGRNGGTPIKICISSVWKNHFTLEEWDKALNNLGFAHNTFVGITGTRCTLRGTEIANWMKDNSFTGKYAIIDDDSDMLDSQAQSCFFTDPYVGLTPNTCWRIKLHFNKN